ETMFQSAYGFVEHILPATPFVAGDLTALDADERSGITQFAQAVRDCLRNELAVGEELEVAVGMRCKQVEQLRVHERLASQNAEERVAMALGVGDRAIERAEVNGVLFFHVHPATLTTQVARVDDRDVEKRRKILAALDAPLEFLNRQHSLHPEVPG